MQHEALPIVHPGSQLLGVTMEYIIQWKYVHDNENPYGGWMHLKGPMVEKAAHIAAGVLAGQHPHILYRVFLAPDN